MEVFLCDISVDEKSARRTRSWAATSSSDLRQPTEASDVINLFVLQLKPSSSRDTLACTPCVVVLPRCRSSSAARLGVALACFEGGLKCRLTRKLEGFVYVSVQRRTLADWVRLHWLRLLTRLVSAVTNFCSAFEIFNIWALEGPRRGSSLSDKR